MVCCQELYGQDARQRNEETSIVVSKKNGHSSISLPEAIV